MTTFVIVRAEAFCTPGPLLSLTEEFVTVIVPAL